MDADHNSGRKGILITGNLLLDRIKVTNHYPEETQVALIDKVDISSGGCTNTLLNLAAIDSDIPLFLAGLTGQDEDGCFLLRQATQRNIDTTLVNQLSKIPTAFSDVIINSRSGDRTVFHLPGTNTQLTEQFISQLQTRAHIVHIAYLNGLPALECYAPDYQSKAARAMASLKSMGYLVSVDLVSSPEISAFEHWVKPALRFVDYLIINDQEACALAGVPIPEEGNTAAFMKLAERLLTLGVQQSVIIHYPSGATGLEKHGQAVSVPAYAVKPEDIVSTLGAGDAFCAGALYGLHQQMPLEKCMQLGCAAAYFSLFSLSATGNAKPLNKLEELISHT
ncbi:carbohydrate kinase family protein [Spongorhabdus nitratireducens]